MRDKLRVLLTDAHGFMEYRNKVYGLKYQWPKSNVCNVNMHLHCFATISMAIEILFIIGLDCVALKNYLSLR